jgi:hypothetical protein
MAAMPGATLALLGVVVFATSLVGAVTGGMSLVNVPVMMLCGLQPRTAVATNMFALAFMSGSAALRFRREKLIDASLALPMCAVTLVTSVVGAQLLVMVSERAVKVTVAVSMGALLAFMLVRGAAATEPPAVPSPATRALGWILVTLLGIYGGLYSGGYTTLLTFVCVVLLGVPLLRAVALTKVVNLVSCAAASVVYLRAGSVDLKLGAALAVVCIAGGWIGAHLAIKRGAGFVRGLFMAMVAALAVKLAVDLFG